MAELFEPGMAVTDLLTSQAAEFQAALDADLVADPLLGGHDTDDL